MDSNSFDEKEVNKIIMNLPELGDHVKYNVGGAKLIGLVLDVRKKCEVVNNVSNFDIGMNNRDIPYALIFWLNYSDETVLNYPTPGYGEKGIWGFVEGDINKGWGGPVPKCAWYALGSYASSRNIFEYDRSLFVSFFNIIERKNE